MEDREKTLTLITKNAAAKTVKRDRHDYGTEQISKNSKSTSRSPIDDYPKYEGSNYSRNQQSANILYANEPSYVDHCAQIYRDDDSEPDEYDFSEWYTDTAKAKQPSAILVGSSGKLPSAGRDDVPEVECGRRRKKQVRKWGP